MPPPGTTSGGRPRTRRRASIPRAAPVRLHVGARSTCVRRSGRAPWRAGAERSLCRRARRAACADGLSPLSSTTRPGVASSRRWSAARRSSRPRRPGANRSSFLQDYSLVGIGDLFSLVFCNGWTEPYLIEGYQAILPGIVLTISPDPFAGTGRRLRGPARRVPQRRYASDEELRATWPRPPSSC